MVEPLSSSVEKLVEYGYRYNIYVYKDLDQYYRRKSAGIKRILWVSFCRLALIMSCLRFVNLDLLRKSNSKDNNGRSVDQIHKSFGSSSCFERSIIWQFLHARFHAIS